MVTKGPHLVCMFSVIRKVRTTQNWLFFIVICWWIFSHMSPTGMYKIIIRWKWSKGKFWNSQKSNIFVLRKGGGGCLNFVFRRNSVIRKVRTTQNCPLHEKYCQDVREITMPLLLLMIFLVLFHYDIIMTSSMTFNLNIKLKYCLIIHYFNVFIWNWIPN